MPVDWLKKTEARSSGEFLTLGINLMLFSLRKNITKIFQLPLVIWQFI